MHPAAVGPYKIEKELGRGGMGEVFLARDLRLDRLVAIKALPPHLAAEPERMARFQREAKVLASLNHPGVGAIYGLEEADGHHYLVLEFIDGETLAERLMNGAIPRDEALSIARQIADALSAAHEKGIVHRDLKPANVMISDDGVVKVVDFGLARTAEGAPSTTNAAALANSPTMLANSPTIPGAIMGTAGYMSPEQARGKPVDKRSDIFSFGCVLYEMLSGVQPFPGETVADSIGAILHREPDWSRLPPTTGARVRELLRGCMAKDRRNRLHDIADARIELERAIAGDELAGATVPVTQAPPARSPWRAPLLAVGAVALLGLGWVASTMLVRPPAAPASTPLYLSVPMPAKPRFSGFATISPDERLLVCTVSSDTADDSSRPGGQLMVRRLDRDEVKLIEGTEGARSAAFSPDGRSLVFVASKDRTGSRSQVRRMPVVGGQPSGTPETLYETQGFAGEVCWVSNQEILLATPWNDSLVLLSTNGAAPRVVLREENKKDLGSWGSVHAVGDGRHVLVTRWRLEGPTQKEWMELVDVQTGTRSTVLEGAGGARVVELGAGAGGCFLLGSRGNSALVAAPFDRASLKVTGPAVTVWSGRGVRGFDLSRSGMLVVPSDGALVSGRKVAAIDDQGQPVPLGLPARAYSVCNFSPDGLRAVCMMDSMDQAELPAELWMLDVTRRSLSRMTTAGLPIETGIFSPDGQRIAYGTINETESAIWERRADGSGEAVRLYTSPDKRRLLIPRSFSADGRLLAATSVDLSVGTPQIFVLERGADGEPWKDHAYLSPKGGADNAIFLPGGKWISYDSSESGRMETFVQRFSGPANGDADAKAGRVQLTSGGTGGVWWSPDGKEVRYGDGDRQIFSAPLQMEPTLSVGAPKLLYSFTDLKTRSWGFSPDGRVRAVLSAEEELNMRISVVLHFFDEIASRMAAAK